MLRCTIRENAAAIAAGEIAELTESSVEFIEKASGIGSRFVVDKAGILDPRTYGAADRRARQRRNLDPRRDRRCGNEGCAGARRADASQVDAVLCAASNTQRPYPAMAVEIQDALGIDGFGFDMNVACSSATFGIQTAADYIRAGHAKSVLVVNPEICSGHLNWRDRDSHFHLRRRRDRDPHRGQGHRAPGARGTSSALNLQDRILEQHPQQFRFPQPRRHGGIDKSGLKSDKLFVREKAGEVFMEVVDADGW